MKALSVLYGGRLGPEAFETLPQAIESGVNTAFSMALNAALRFPGIQKTVILGLEGKEYPQKLSENIVWSLRPSWTKKSLLEELSRLSAGYDFAYFAWADCPLLDPDLAGALADRHIRYAAEYSYADGWPCGFAPELIAPETAGILSKLIKDDDGPVERDALFSVIQKDINAFDIETEISPVDLRQYRLSLTADSKRNLLLLSRFMQAGISAAPQSEIFIRDRQEQLRTLPAFFGIQVCGACPQACPICPWPGFGEANGVPVTARKDFMPKEAFTGLLDRIVEFAGDAVIDLSLWGELALHPDRVELAEMVLARPALSLVIETSGIGWKPDELKALAASASKAEPRKNLLAPLSWIVSLDAHDPLRYREVRGPGFAEACACAKTLLELFPRDAYVQAVRVKGFEDDIEQFYRSWKGEGQADGRHIIIQKYDDFAGTLPKMQASDLSPVKRRPCWHIQRDMNILLDGSVPCCREDLGALKGKGSRNILGNVFSDDLSAIWKRGEAVYKEHCALVYEGICAGCDEWYTFNF